MTKELTLIAHSASEYFKSSVSDIEKIGEGFYGIVYCISLEKAPGSVIFKQHKFPGHAGLEAKSLEHLYKHQGTLRVPRVYTLYERSGLFMEHLEGVMASELINSFRSKREADVFYQAIAENLYHFHSVVSPGGFGELETPNFKSWKEFLRRRIDCLYHRYQHTICEHRTSPFSPIVSSLIESSYGQFDRIFSDEPSRPVLVHGDYNLWNILADPKTRRPVAVIDPGDACWGDREMDLFHLRNANADPSLFQAYQNLGPLSRSYPAKEAFYCFWDDLKHSLNTGWYEEDRFIRFGKRAVDRSKAL